MTDSVPEKLGKYKIIEEVGRGGFAAVYKAVDTTLDRTVALKVLAPHLLWDPTFVQRFQREASVAANLDHSNIVTIYEVGLIEGVYFIAMQFLEGRTLSQILEAEGPLPVSRVRVIIEQMASALDYAHARGFVHRDIKPSNVIVAEDGQATLTDFGLVKAGEGTQLSTTGMAFGTPEYTSPEQAEGKKLDARSDIYSLGVVLFAMLVGRAPFVADTTPAVMYKHVHEPPPLDELPSDLPEGVVAVLEKALAKKREERYQGAGEMAAALKQAVSRAIVEEVEAPLEPVLHPSLTLRLSVKPQTVDAGGEAQWTVTLRNDGDDDLRHVTVRRARTLLDEPFDLAAGKGRRFTFTTTYKTEGKKTEKVTATGIASTGQSVRHEARAAVQVTPIPPEPEVSVPLPVVKKQKGLAKLEEEAVPLWRRVPVWAWAAAVGGVILLAVVGGVFMAGRGQKVKPTSAVVQATTPAVTVSPQSVSPTATESLAVVSPTSTPVPATPTPTVAIAATQTAVADAVKATVLAEATATAEAAATATAGAFTPTPTLTQTPEPPTATATSMPRTEPTPTPTPVPPPAGPIALTIYFRDTRTETGFAALSGDQVQGGTIYEEGRFVYGEAAVQIGATTYHFDKPEVGPGEPEQLPDPWRVEFEFAEELVARTGNQAGFDPKKAQFWAGTLDGNSAMGEDNPYSLTMKLYEGNEVRESIKVFFTVADAPGPGGGGPGGTPPKPEP